MKSVRNIIIAVIILIAIGGIYFQLKRNKTKINSEVAMAAKEVDAIPVKVERAKISEIKLNIQSNGSLEANQQLTVVSQTQGKIIRLYKNLGDAVRKGEIIAKVEDETISAAVMVAEANVDQQKKDIERYKRLSEGDAISKHDLEQAQIGLKKAEADLIRGKKELSNTSITAPISGIINQKFITEGQFLSGGTPICEIVDNHQLKLHIKMDGNDIYQTSKNQTVNVNISVFPNRTFTGKVTAVAVKADQSMKFDVEITLNNSKEVVLKSGLYAEVQFPVTTKKCLVIRKESITGSMEKPRVFVVEKNKAVLKNIEIGTSNDDYVEIVSGLNNGDEVIYNGQLNLDNNDQVKIIN